ncbi:DUF6049 family protein [Blastococcus sp. SYSU D00820]
MSRPRATADAAPALLRALLAALLAVPLLVLPSPAAAAPGDGTSEDDAADRPVRIEITRLDPATVTPGAAITLAGTLTNTGDETLADLTVRLQRGEAFGTRRALLAADSDPDPATTVAADFQPLAGTLAPGDTREFSYTTTTTDLQLGGDGVYPVLLNLNGTTDGGGQSRIGELATYVVQQSAPPLTGTSVAWLWPITEPSHRDAEGEFVDDGLAEAVTSGGRLDRALAAVERIPDGVLPDGQPTGTPAARVTLAVDPALVEELTVMAAGPYAVGEGEGTGTEDAAAFLERLSAAAAEHPVLALPYGDVDVDGLVAAGLGAVVSRALPAGGTAQARPATDGQAPPAGGAEDEDGAEAGAGARILRDALGVEPRTDVAWPGAGGLRPETLQVLADGGVDTVVVPSSGLADGDRALGLDGTPATARSDVAGTGTAALVADSGLAQVVAGADSAAGGARIAGQRYLAELALVAARGATDPVAVQSVLVAPPRGLDVDPAGAAAMIGATVQLPGLRSATLADLLSAPAADTGGLAEPGEPALDGAALADVTAALAVRDDIAGAVVGDPAVALAPQDAAVARATSLARQDDPDGARAAAADLRRALTELRGAVTLLAPADGTYSLASSDAPLVLTVRNDLPFAVRVLLDVRTRGNVGLTVADIGAQELAPGERTVLQVPTEVRQSGRFGVTATITTPDGGALGSPVELQVTSTAYGVISLIITIGAAALLGLLFLRRLVLFVLRRRRGTPGDEEDRSVPPEGAAVPLPPTRSPV